MRLSILALAIAAAVVSAQTNSTTCCDVTPSSVDMNKRLSWCRAQQNTCPEVCENGQTASNACDVNALTYDCKCLTGNTPNISDYMQTLPSLECDEWKAQCTAAHPNDLAGQNFCQSFTCGQKNASALVASSSSGGSGSGSPSSTTSGTSPSSTTTGGATSTKSSAAVAMLRTGRDYGTPAILIGLTALFGFAL